MPFQRSQDTYRRQLFLSFKGGTGKTTLSAAYGLHMAEEGYSVLFVDLDPQGHLTQCVGIDEWQFDKTLYHVLLRDTPIEDVVKRIPGVDACIVPSDMSLSAAELALGALPYREWRLVHALSSLKRDFDLVVFDASPTISLLNLNAALACKDLIIPVLPDHLSLHGLKTTIKVLDAIEADFDHRFVNVGILLNRFVDSDAHCRDTRQTLQMTYEGRLLRTVVRECPELRHPQPFRHRLWSRVAIDKQARFDIQSLAAEIGPKGRPTNRKGKQDE